MFILITAIFVGLAFGWVPALITWLVLHTIKFLLVAYA